VLYVQLYGCHGTASSTGIGKGAITSKIKHAIKHKTSPASFAGLVLFYCMFYFTCDRSLMEEAV